MSDLYHQVRYERGLLQHGLANLVARTTNRCGSKTSCSPADQDLIRRLNRTHMSNSVLRSLQNQFDSGWTQVGVPVLHLSSNDVDGVIDNAPLLIFTDGGVCDRPSSNDDIVGWVEKSSQFLVHDTTLETSVLKPLPSDVAPEYRSTYDAFRMIPEMDPYKAFLGEPLNPLVRMPMYEPKFKYTGDFTAAPVNARGNPKKMRSALRIGTSIGLTYDTDDHTQVMLTAAVRYAGPKKQMILDDEGRALAVEIATNMFEEIVDRSKLASAWNDMSTSSVYLGWLKKAKSAGYASSHSLAAEDDDRILRFQGKGSFKAKETLISSESKFKAPQGIMAWSKGAVSFFGAACRMITDVTRKSLKDHVVWNNGLTVEEAARQFIAATTRVPTNENVRIDAVEMDSKQNEFTHHIVKSFLKLMLVSDDFVELYFSMMEDFQVTNPNFKMFLQWVKASGEPFTLYGNTFLMISLTLWLIRGEGPFALFGQGDDVDYNRANMYVDEDRLANIALYCEFVMTTDWADYAAFCGYVLKDGLLTPNIRRKLIKLLGMSYRDIKHFCAVQDSIRVWSDLLISHPGFPDMVKVNAETYSVSIDTANTWFDCIASFGHVDASQFREIAMSVDINPKFIGANGYVESVY